MEELAIIYAALENKVTWMNYGGLLTLIKDLLYFFLEREVKRGVHMFRLTVAVSV